jgi:hypothetical protein
MQNEEEVERDAEGELVRLDYDLDTLKGERAIKVIDDTDMNIKHFSLCVKITSVSLKIYIVVQRSVDYGRYL